MADAHERAAGHRGGALRALVARAMRASDRNSDGGDAAPKGLTDAAAAALQQRSSAPAELSA